MGCGASSSLIPDTDSGHANPAHIHKASKAMQLYYNKACPYAHRAYLTAVEKGLIASGAVELVEVPIPTPDWYWKINPRQTVPALQLEDGVSVVPDSMVVVQFFNDAYPEPTPLMPESPKDRADIRVFLGDVDALFSGLFKVLHEEDDEKRKELIRSSEDDIAYIERALAAKSQGPYFLGEQYSLVDVAMVTFLDRFRYTLPHFRQFDALAHAPRMRALLDAMEKRPAFQQTAQPKDVYLAFYGNELHHDDAHAS